MRGQLVPLRYCGVAQGHGAAGPCLPCQHRSRRCCLCGAGGRLEGTGKQHPPNPTPWAPLETGCVPLSVHGAGLAPGRYVEKAMPGPMALPAQCQSCPRGWQGPEGRWLAQGPVLQIPGEPATVGIVQKGLIFQYFPSLLNALSAWGVKPPGRLLRATTGTARPPLPRPSPQQRHQPSCRSVPGQGQGACQSCAEARVPLRWAPARVPSPGSASRLREAGPGLMLSSVPGAARFWNRLVPGQGQDLVGPGLSGAGGWSPDSFPCGCCMLKTCGGNGRM